MLPVEFNTVLARLLQGLKRDLGALTVRQGYRGTGRSAHRRQIFVHFSNDRIIDLWLEADNVGMGGVIRPSSQAGQELHEGRQPEQVYAALVERLRSFSA